MTETLVMDLGRNAFVTIMLLSLPLLGVSLIVGLAIGLIQAVTQVHEVTLTFVPKILAVMIVAGLLSSWMLQRMLTFTATLFNLLSRVGV